MTIMKTLTQARYLFSLYSIPEAQCIDNSSRRSTVNRYFWLAWRKRTTVFLFVAIFPLLSVIGKTRNILLKSIGKSVDSTFDVVMLVSVDIAFCFLCVLAILLHIMYAIHSTREMIARDFCEDG